MGLEGKLSDFHGVRAKKDEGRENQCWKKNLLAAGWVHEALSSFGAPDSAPSFFMGTIMSSGLV